MSNLKKKNNGQALVEFALIIPIILLVVFVIIEGSYLFWMWLTLQDAAREATRYATTGQFETDCLNAATPCSDARVFSIESVVISKTNFLRKIDGVAFEEAGYFEVQVMAINEDNQWEMDYAGISGRPVLVRAYHQVPLLTPLSILYDSIALSGEVIMNNERYDQVVDTSMFNQDNVDFPEPPPPAATDTPTSTASPTATATPTDTPTITPTPTDTLTPTPGPSPTPSNTATPTNTPTPTDTPTPTNTPSPTFTPTPVSLTFNLPCQDIPERGTISQDGRMEPNRLWIGRVGTKAIDTARSHISFNTSMIPAGGNVVFAQIQVVQTEQILTGEDTNVYPIKVHLAGPAGFSNNYWMEPTDYLGIVQQLNAAFLTEPTGGGAGPLNGGLLTDPSQLDGQIPPWGSRVQFRLEANVVTNDRYVGLSLPGQCSLAMEVLYPVPAPPTNTPTPTLTPDPSLPTSTPVTITPVPPTTILTQLPCINLGSGTAYRNNGIAAPQIVIGHQPSSSNSKFDQHGFITIDTSSVPASATFLNAQLNLVQWNTSPDTNVYPISVDLAPVAGWNNSYTLEAADFAAATAAAGTVATLNEPTGSGTGPLNGGVLADASVLNSYISPTTTILQFRLQPNSYVSSNHVGLNNNFTSLNNCSLSVEYQP